MNKLKQFLMQKNILLFGLFCLAIFTISCKKERIETQSQTDYDKQMLDTINAHRIGKGLTALVHNDFLWQIANEHTENMANGDVPFGHSGATERSDRIKLQLGNGSVAENVAANKGTITEVVESWLTSTGHKSNMEGNYALTGLSAVQSKDGTWYYTQIFFKSN